MSNDTHGAVSAGPGGKLPAGDVPLQQERTVADSPPASGEVEEERRGGPQPHTATDRRGEGLQNPAGEREERQVLEDIFKEIEKIQRERQARASAGQVTLDLGPEEETEKVWTSVADTVKRYSDEMIDRWNKQIDTYLVFAGLFSAVLTAFNVQSYPLLKQDAPDTTALSLQQISLQLQSFAISPPFVNSTQPAIAVAPIAPSAPSPVPRYAIRLNILWFSALILSLASAVIGIFAKQWLSEYSSGLTGNSREAARLRQYRLNNLEKWRVNDMIVLIPVLLLISLALFLAGLLVLLWELHPAVALVTSILVGLLAVSTILITLLPLFRHDCAYISPQTRVLTPFFHLIISAALCLTTALHALLCAIGRLLFPSHLREVLVQCFTGRWAGVPGPMIVAEMMLQDSLSIWQDDERLIVRSLGQKLDVDLLIKAYHSSLDSRTVFSALILMLSYPSSTPGGILQRFIKSVRQDSGAAAAELHAQVQATAEAWQRVRERSGGQ